jgi:hypothetical protein
MYHAVGKKRVKNSCNSGKESTIVTAAATFERRRRKEGEEEKKTIDFAQ